MSATFRDLAQPFLDEGVLSPADVHTVGLVAPRFGETDGPRLLGLAFAVRAPSCRSDREAGFPAAHPVSERTRRATSASSSMWRK